MTPRHIALAVGAVAVFAIGLYLFVEVRSAPAQTPSSPSHITPPPVVAENPTPTEPKLTTPTPPPPVADPPTQRITDEEAAAAARESAARESAKRLPGLNPFRQKIDATSGKLEPIMAAANKAYDKGDFDEARQIAAKILANEPGNERMLRIMVSSSCIEGDSSEAQKYFNLLPARDRGAMKTRCERYGVNFIDPPTQ